MRWCARAPRERASHCQNNYSEESENARGEIHTKIAVFFVSGFGSLEKSTRRLADSPPLRRRAVVSTQGWRQISHFRTNAYLKLSRPSPAAPSWPTLG
jgi:hypothetical protein